MHHAPILRAGRDYESLEKSEVTDLRTGEVLAEVSQANPGLVRRDLRNQDAHAAVARAVASSEWIDICKRAGDLFLNGALPLSEGGEALDPDAYVALLSRTSGLPHALCRANMRKIHLVLDEMPTILRGLTRGIDLGVLDAGYGEQGGVPVSYAPAARSLGVVLPSNSPGVNSIWVPSLPLKTPVVLKPGREEPWTPLRIARAYLEAGAPPECLSFYPTSHEGAGAILERCDRSQLFGDARTTAPYKNNRGVELHGPGYSKVLMGADACADFERHLDTLVDSIAANGGRSCINASTILVADRVDEIADALAARLARIEPRPADDPEARLSAFANPKVADWLEGVIAGGLGEGARDVTARHRDAGSSLGAGDTRRVELDGATYMRPTLVQCDSLDHPLARTEMLFPYASIVQVPQEQLVEAAGDSLVATVIGEDDELQRAALDAPGLLRLNLGPAPTSHVDWDQPHEGNLFEFLWVRRAIKRVTA